MSYDRKCHELAELFIDGEPKLVKTPELVVELAQQIHDTIEDFLQYGVEART